MFHLKIAIDIPAWRLLSLLFNQQLMLFHVCFTLKKGAGDQQHQFQVRGRRETQQWTAEEDEGASGQILYVL